MTVSTTPYADIVHDGYRRIYDIGGNDLRLDDSDKIDILQRLDKEAPEENIKSQVKVWFDGQDGSFLGSGRPGGSWWSRGIDTKWIPFPGVDPNTPVRNQNAQNGVIIQNKCRNNFAFNDILEYDEVTYSTYGGKQARMHFKSMTLKTSIPMLIKYFGDVARQMKGGFLIGRFCFCGTGGNLSIRPMEWPDA